MHINRISPLSLLLLPSYVLGQDIATLNPCPQDSNAQSITVTAQYQPVSTCFPVTSDGSTAYSYSTYDFVQTTIPIAAEGTFTSDVVVTNTAQWITVTAYPEATITPASKRDLPEIVQKHGLCPYNEIGDFAIPGWGGSGLCTECDVVAADGSRRQKIYMQECRQKGTWRSCENYEVYWIFTPVPEAPAVFYPVCAAHTYIEQAGTYTFSFPQPAITSTITQGNGQVITACQPPWWAYVTKSFEGPTTCDFTTTVTRTITLVYPYQTGQPSNIITITNPPPTGYPSPGSGFGEGAILTSPNGGQYTTRIVTPIGTGIGSVPVTATIAQPSGTNPGTVIVVDAPTLTGTGPASTTPMVLPTGPYVTITITGSPATAASSGGPVASTPVTVTIVLPSGTAPGTVVVIDPVAPLTGTVSSTTSPATFETNTSGGTVIISPVPQSSSESLTTMTTDGTVIVSPVATSTTTSSGGDNVGAILTSMTTFTSDGTTYIEPITIVSSESFTTFTSSGAVIVSPVLTSTTTSSGGDNVGAILTSMTTFTSEGTTYIEPITTVSSESFTTFTSSGAVIVSPVLTSTANPSVTTTCVGAVCVAVSVSLPVGDVGASVTLLPGSNAPCVGLLCASVGVSATDIGATVTAGVGSSIDASVGVTATDVGATVTLGVGSSVAASVGVSVTDVGASITLGVGSSGIDASIGATLPVVGSLTLTVGIPNPTDISGATTACNGLLCASVGASSIPIVGGGATITAGVGSSIDASVGVSATDVGATITVGLDGSSVAGSVGVSATDVGASVTLGVGSSGIGASIGATAPIIGSVTLTVGIPNPTNLLLGGNTGNAVATTACNGLLCASVGVSSIPIIGGVTITAGLLGGNNAQGTTLVTSTIPPASNAAATTVCNGILCASVGVSSIPIVGGVTLTAGGILVRKSAEAEAATPAVKMIRGVAWRNV